MRGSDAKKRCEISNAANEKLKNPSVFWESTEKSLYTLLYKICNDVSLYYSLRIIVADEKNLKVKLY